MLNLLIRSNRYIGYIDRELTPEEIEAGEYTVIEVESLPEEIANTPKGHYVEYDGESFLTVPYPSIPVSNQQQTDPIAALNAKLVLMQIAIDEMILGGEK